jgi:hypothetical protein
LDVPNTLFVAFVSGITGGDNSPDRQRLVLSDYFTARTKRCCPRRAAFDAVWQQEYPPYRH